MSTTGNEANEAMTAAKEVERLAGVVASNRFVMIEPELSDAICVLGAEYRKLRKIAAYVPGRVWMKAKEDAGFGTAIVPLDNDPPDSVGCHACGELVFVYDRKCPEEAVCPEHCPDHDYQYERGERKHLCTVCGDEAPPDFHDVD